MVLPPPSLELAVPKKIATATFGKKSFISFPLSFHSTSTALNANSCCPTFSAMNFSLNKRRGGGGRGGGRQQRRKRWRGQGKRLKMKNRDEGRTESRAQIRTKRAVHTLKESSYFGGRLVTKKVGRVAWWRPQLAYIELDYIPFTISILQLLYMLSSLQPRRSV